jgi:Do/DeqQ family serine protease
MKKRQLILIVLLSLVASFSGAYIFKTFFNDSSIVLIENDNKTPTRAVNAESLANLENGFVAASKKSTPSVVFIKTESQYQRNSFWGFDFDPFGSIGKVASTGSGVIVTQDGYIITNHHVVQNADKIEVVLSDSKKTLAAELIGTDPSSDLALLKINAKNLTNIEFQNSDNVEIGQWVLAVGNPFNLTSTVTAGIVSAKGRNINIVNNQFPIESFIQTDAAINPGNSGGALVDLNGNLIGVNTAIASKTGSYVGYGFAIPSNIVAKTIKDLKEYGEVQRGFLGVDVVDIDGDISEKLGVERGVLIKRVTGTNSFSDTKLQAGDVITKIDGKEVDSKATFDELLSYQRPGDLTKVEVVRDATKKEFDIKLVNKEGTTELIKKESVQSSTLGAEFELISKLEKQTYKVENGIKVFNITNGKIRKMNIPEGFIFTKVNQKEFGNLDDFIAFLEQVKGQIRIEGISPNGAKQYLSFYFY